MDKRHGKNGDWHGLICLGEQERELLELRSEGYVDMLGKERLRMVQIVDNSLP